MTRTPEKGRGNLPCRLHKPSTTWGDSRGVEGNDEGGGNQLFHNPMRPNSRGANRLGCPPQTGSIPAASTSQPQLSLDTLVEKVGKVGTSTMRCTREDDGARPASPLAAWRDTRDTLRVRMQIVGKARRALRPHVNPWWEAARYLTPRRLTTSPFHIAAGASVPRSISSFTHSSCSQATRARAAFRPGPSRSPTSITR
jgi:hypothetical protein